MGDALPVTNLGTGKLAIQIAAGVDHTCARLSTGDVKCWGLNARAQLGLGDLLNRGDDPGEMGDSLPAVSLGTGKAAIQIAAGWQFSCALVTGGLVKCWGDGEFGVTLGTAANPMGDSPSEMGDALVAIPLGTGLTAKAIAAGLHHACALLSNNQVKCWGDGSFGQLGQGDTATRTGMGGLGDALPVVNLGTGRSAKAIYAYSNTTCALLDTNQVKCWGDNGSGSAGIGAAGNRGDGPAEMGDYLPTVQLGTGSLVTTMAAGGLGASPCALLDNRLLKCWGANGSGELGIRRQHVPRVEAHRHGKFLAPRRSRDGALGPSGRRRPPGIWGEKTIGKVACEA